MKISPLFKWFGSKWQAAKRYPKPMFDTIVEPFCGGAGYSLNYSDRRVVLYDNDPHLKVLWKWLIDSATSEDILAIPINLPEGSSVNDPALGLNLGQRLLLKHWQRTNNVGNCWTISPWGSKPGQWTRNTRARVADEVHAVKHWEFGDTIGMVDLPCTWFIDPPYIYNYRYRDGKNFPYDQLDSLVQTISASSQVMVCEASCPKTGKVPNYLPFLPNHSSVTSRRKVTQSHHSSEYLYYTTPKELKTS